MITKKNFVNFMTAMEKQRKKDNKATDHLQKIFEDFQGYYKNEVLFETIEKFLEEEFKDEYDWIGYYMYDLNWGTEWNKYCCKEKDGTMIDISTVEKLYDFLIKNMKEKNDN